MNIKVLTIYKSLSQGEISALNSVIKSKGNNSLKKTLEGINKNQNARNKEEFKVKIFKHVYGKAYQAKEDYLLRNLFRLLCTEMEDVLCKIANAPTDKLTLVKLYYQRGLNNLAEKEINKLQNSKTVQDYQAVYDLAKYQLDYSINHLDRPIDKNNLREVIELTKEAMTSNAKSYLSNLYNLQYYFAYLERQLTAVEPDYKLENTEHFLLIGTSINDEQLKEQRLKVNVHHTDPKERKKALASLVEIIAKKPAPANELQHYQYQLGSEHFLVGEFEKAIEYYTPACKYLKQSNHPSYAGMLFNYLTALAKTQEYAAVTQILAEEDELISNSSTTPQYLCLQICSLILLGNIAGAETLFPNEINTGSDHLNNYFRLIQAMLHFENGLHELASNELKNLIRRFDSASEVEPGLRATTLLMNDMVIFSSKRGSKSNTLIQTTLKELNEEHKALMKAYPFGMLPLDWIATKLV